jgi:uncharacterized phage protein (TIGR02218 family)
MKSIPAALAAHLRGETSTLAVCWLVEKSNGTVIRGTEHDRDIVVTAAGSPPINLSGRYYARANITGSDTRLSADLSADNMEVDGATDGDVDVTVAEMEAGVMDNAPVTIFLLNWRDPSAGQVILLRGRLGALSRDSDGRYRVEVRGLGQLLAQNVGQTYADRCNVVRFGDARCKFNTASITGDGVVSTVASRKAFAVAFGSPTPAFPATLPAGGEVHFTSGENSGFAREVKTATYVADVLSVELYEELPAELEVGDSVSFTPGCDRRYETCRDLYDNLANFRGYGVFVPGALRLMAGPAPTGQCNFTDEA